MNRRPRFFMQTDDRWKSKDYSATGESTTIGASGCGPTCAAMLISTLTGKEYTPVDACKWSLAHGYKAVNQGTYYAYFQPQFAAFGINCKQLNTSNAYGNKSASVHAEALRLLKEGYYLIACMGKGLWTSAGHFVVAWWADGKIRINDPASTKSERLNGDMNTFLSQVKYYFAVDARSHNKGGGEVSTTTKKIALVPLKDIGHIEIYVNKNSKTMAAIKKETSADYIMNGGLFNGDWTACPHLKVDGDIVSTASWSAWGYGWDIGPDIKMDNQRGKYDNYISCIDLINPWNGTDAKLSYDKAVGGRRGRTAIGIGCDNLVLYCSKDGSKDRKNPEELRDEMVELGCDTAVMLDGGGSSQCNFRGSAITASRRVHNFILVYLKGNTPLHEDDDLTDIEWVQAELNERYDAGLMVDGSWGPASKKAMVKAVQTELNKLYKAGLTVDGSFGPASQSKFPDIKQITKNNLAWLVQACLLVKGYDLDCDGSYGPSTARFVKDFQKKNGLVQDAICGRNTMTKLLG